MKLVFSLLLLLTAINVNAANIPKAPSEVVLFSRYINDDYNAASYSFRKMSQDVKVHRNNVDVLFEAREDLEDRFHVNMVVDDVSFIFDLGNRSCKDIESAYPEYRQMRPLVWLAYSDATTAMKQASQDTVKVNKNHCYLVYGNDEDGRVVTLFHVRAHEKSKKVIIDEIEVLDLFTIGE